MKAIGRPEWSWSFLLVARWSWFPENAVILWKMKLFIHLFLVIVVLFDSVEVRWQKFKTQACIIMCCHYLTHYVTRCLPLETSESFVGYDQKMLIMYLVVSSNLEYCCFWGAFDVWVSSYSVHDDITILHCLWLFPIPNRIIILFTLVNPQLPTPTPAVM